MAIAIEISYTEIAYNYRTECEFADGKITNIIRWKLIAVRKYFEQSIRCGNISLHAKNTKSFSIITSSSIVLNLQSNLDKFFILSRQNFLQLNVNKYNIIAFFHTQILQKNLICFVFHFIKYS